MMQAFMRGLEAEAGSGELREALEDISTTLTLEQISQVSRAAAPCCGQHALNFL